VRNYPEYPDDNDVHIKFMAKDCGMKDFARAKAIVDLIIQLRGYSIQDLRFVMAALDFYFLDHQVGRRDRQRRKAKEVKT